MRWKRWLAPVAGAALLGLLLALAAKGQLGHPKSIRIAHDGQEIEIPLEETSILSFRSDVEGVSVVWITN